MRFVKMFALIFAIIFSFSSIICIDCCMASSLNICVADINMIFKKSHAEKDAKLELEVRQKEMEKILDKVAKEISVLSDNFSRESEVINEKFIEKKKREVRIRINDFKDLKVKFQEELDSLQKKLIFDIETEIIEIISNVGKTKECKIIINRTSVLYFNKSIDITDEVLSKYNDNYVKSKNN